MIDFFLHNWPLFLAVIYLSVGAVIVLLTVITDAETRSYACTTLGFIFGVALFIAFWPVFLGWGMFVAWTDGKD